MFYLYRGRTIFREMNYKKIIKSQNFRFAILKALRWVPDCMMLKIQYWIKLGRRCELNNPKRWTEKLQVYKMYYRNPILSQCVDKYEVRKYVESRGCAENLVKLYGLWNLASEIDFEKLPSSFVLKTTNGGGGEDVVLVRDKEKCNLQEKVVFLDRKRVKEVNGGREWAYTGISTPRIIAEELLVNMENPEAGVEDFKILCFHGEPYYIIVDKDRYIDHKRNFYTTSWERVNVTTDHEQFDTPYPQPSNLQEMLDVARKLSADFPFVRVDLYNVEGKIYFGELTFYPWTGYVQFSPDEFDFTLGKLMDCSSFMK